MNPQPKTTLPAVAGGTRFAVHAVDACDRGACQTPRHVVA